MRELSATDAARNFSDILDAVEHGGERFAIVRRGKVIARIDPAGTGTGQDVKAMLGRQRADPDFSRDLQSLRALLEMEHRP